MARKGIIWEGIEKEGFVSYDGLTTIIKDTLAPLNPQQNELAYEIEDRFNELFGELLDKLEEEY